MKLYIKQKVFSFSDTFYVKDEYGNDKYFVKGEVFSWGHKLHIYDNYNNEVGFIKQKLITFMPRFELTINGLVVGDLVKKISFFRPKYYIEGTSLELEGSIMEHDYSLNQAGMPIMRVYKEWFTWGDSYVLDILNPQDELLGLAVVLAVDCEICSRHNQ